VSLLVTTKQKLKVNTQKKIRKESKHNIKEIHQATGKREKENCKNGQKTINKMAISTYLLVIISNVNGLNSPIKRHGGAKWI